MCFVNAGEEVTKKDDKNNQNVAVAANKTTKPNEEDEVKCKILSHLCKPSGTMVIKMNQKSYLIFNPFDKSSIIIKQIKQINFTKEVQLLTFLITC